MYAGLLATASFFPTMDGSYPGPWTHSLVRIASLCSQMHSSDGVSLAISNDVLISKNGFNQRDESEY